MNKQTSYVIIAFLLGVILYQYFLSKKELPVQTTAVIEEDQPLKALMENLTKDKPSTKQAKAKLLTESKQTVIEPTEPRQIELSVDDAAKEATSQEVEPKKPKVTFLTLDDFNVGELERNINDLSLKVRMRREDRGWRVEYLTNQNSMASVGLMNNDLILYEMIERARNNTETKKLIARIERVFLMLQ